MSDDIITISELRYKYSPRAEVVLASLLSPLPRKKGKQREFSIISPLPDYDTFIRMQGTMFNKTLANHVQIAYNELSVILDGLVAFISGLPAGFQKSPHGKAMKKCVDKGKSILLSWPEVPEYLSEATAMFLPADELAMEGRPERRDNIVARLHACLETLEEDYEEDPFIKVLSECANKVKSIQFLSSFPVVDKKAAPKKKTPSKKKKNVH